jgi:hypothetical protein
VFFFKKTSVKKIEATKTYYLKWGKIEVDAPIFRNPHTQGKDNGSTQANHSIEQPFSQKIDHREERYSTKNTDQPEVKHCESKDLGKKGRNIRIKNSFVINMAGGEKRIALIQNLLGSQIVKTFIHPEREGIQRLDENEKDNKGKKNEAHPSQKVSFLLNSFEQNIVQQLFLISSPGLAPFFIPGRLMGF